MLRQLEQADEPALVVLLTEAAHQNVYMLGNMASMGVRHELTEFWGDFADDPSKPTGPELRGIVNRYMDGWCVYGRADADWQALATVLDTYPEPVARLQDNPGGTASLLPYLRRYVESRCEIEELMVLDRANFREVQPIDGVITRPATMQDVDELLELYALAGDMSRTRTRLMRPIRDGYFLVGVVGSQIRSAALVNAVGGGFGMIGGVFTHPEWRGRGLSQLVCTRLCAALFEEGITPSLYWIAPDAGHIYRKLGFHRVGEWRSVWLARAD